jgi:hypothetical protein
MDAATISAITGMVAAFGTIFGTCLMAVIYLRTGHIVKLTNNNFAALQATLDKALADNLSQQQQATETAQKAVIAAAVEAVRQSALALARQDQMLAQQPPGEPVPVVVVAEEPIPVAVVKPEAG